MAGAVGFEPTVHGTKNRCLTTWLRPNNHFGILHQIARSGRTLAIAKGAINKNVT